MLVVNSGLVALTLDLVGIDILSTLLQFLQIVGDLLLLTGTDTLGLLQLSLLVLDDLLVR